MATRRWEIRGLVKLRFTCSRESSFYPGELSAVIALSTSRAPGEKFQPVAKYGSRNVDFGESFRGERGLCVTFSSVEKIAGRTEVSSSSSSSARFFPVILCGRIPKSKRRCARVNGGRERIFTLKALAELHLRNQILAL